MTRLARKGFFWAIGFMLIFLSAGCQEQNMPGTKKSKLIAAENLRLEKELAQRDKENEVLKEQHQKQIKQYQKQLEKCHNDKKTWQEKAQANIKEQVDSVLTAVMDANAKLREEISHLKSEIEELKNQIESREDLEIEIEEIEE